MPLNRIVIVQTSLGHYHFPRIQALAAKCSQAGIDLCNIELSSFIKDYPWVVSSRQATFQNNNLFPDQLLEDIPSHNLWAALRQTLEILHPDVLFLLGYSLNVMRRAKGWAERHKIAAVLISDSNAFDKTRFPLFEYLKKRFVSGFDAAFVAGTSSSQYIQKLGIPAERLAFGCDVIDSAFFIQRAQENRQRMAEIRQRWNLPQNYFLFVGRFIAEKNIFALLSAYEKYVQYPLVGGPAWDLVICGSGPQEAQVKTFIETLPEPLRAKIHLTGYVKQPEIIDYFTCASCFVLPSQSEPWGLVVNEAMACRVPVLVSSKAGASFDLVKNEQNGWTFDPHNREDLAGKMARITRMSAEDRSAMGQSGEDLIACWGLDRFVAGILESAHLAYNHRHPSI
jgi:glycosyltransferase involved in cell wall biosynthesis